MREKSWDEKTLDEKKALLPEALRRARFEKWQEVLKNVDVTDANGDTALLFFAKNLGRSGYTERVIEVLLALGANINYSNPKTGLTPLKAAIAEKGENLADYLRTKGAK